MINLNFVLSLLHSYRSQHLFSKHNLTQLLVCLTSNRNKTIHMRPFSRNSNDYLISDVFYNYRSLHTFKNIFPHENTSRCKHWFFKCSKKYNIWILCEMWLFKSKLNCVCKMYHKIPQTKVEYQKHEKSVNSENTPEREIFNYSFKNIILMQK